MHHSFEFVFMLAALVASPLSAAAQAGEGGVSAEPDPEQPGQSSTSATSQLERWHPEAFVDPSMGAASLAAHPKTQGIRPARIGFFTTMGLTAGGAALLAGGIVHLNRSSDPDFGPELRMPGAGLAFMSVGVVGMVLSGIVWARRGRRHDHGQASRSRQPRKAQRDLTRSAITF